MDDSTNLDHIVKRALTFSNQKLNEIERSTWMAVHEHLHGVLPVEYDIREIDEDLYLKVLEVVKRKLEVQDSNY